MPLSPDTLVSIQAALDTLDGIDADFGFFPAVDGRKRYSCSVRQHDGDLAYGSGSTLTEAYQRAMHDAPIPSSKRRAA